MAVSLVLYALKSNKGLGVLGVSSGLLAAGEKRSPLPREKRRAFIPPIAKYNTHTQRKAASPSLPDEEHHHKDQRQHSKHDGHEDRHRVPERREHTKIFFWRGRGRRGD